MQIAASARRAACCLFISMAFSSAWSVNASAQVLVEGWARATPPGASVGAAYLTLKSDKPDRLAAISSPAAAHAAVHRMDDHDGMMMMAPMAEGLALPAGRTVAMKPGGAHVMLENLTAPLQKGGTLSLHLQFDHAAPMDIAVPVEGVGASGPAH